MTSQHLKTIVQRGLARSTRPFSAAVPRTDPSLTHMRNGSVYGFDGVGNSNKVNGSSGSETSDYQRFSTAAHIAHNSSRLTDAQLTERWEKLANLTNDPMIGKMAEDVAHRCGSKVPK